jgi:hypothetical protein
MAYVQGSCGIRAGFCLLAGGVLAAPAVAEPGTRRGAVPAAFTELVEESPQNKTRLTSFLNGQALPAVVTKTIDGRTIEGRSQQFSRIVIRLPRVNAIAKQ